MAIEINGNYFKKRQSEGEYRLHQWAQKRGNTLFDFYKNPSVFKKQAWTNCRVICYECGGKGLCVVSGNTFNFTAAFAGIDIETGVINRVFWMTRSGMYYADVKEV